jgi:hypothetical protein
VVSLSPDAERKLHFHPPPDEATARARPGRLRGLSVLRRESGFCGAFVLARRALSGLTRRFLPGQYAAAEAEGYRV